MGNRSQPSLHPLESNVRTVARLEEEALIQRSAIERISAVISSFLGSAYFVVLHVLWFGLWMAANMSLIPGIKPFDPYPFALLSLIVALEAVFLTSFVLINQNHMSRRADRRAHLDLQVNLLAEQEMTAVLDMLHKIGKHLGVEPAPGQIEKLVENTDVKKLVEQLDERLPGE